MRAFTGTDTFNYATVVPPNYGRVEPGVPAVATTIHYATFSAAVEETGLSRLYAGIHYAGDNTDEQLLGVLSVDEGWKKSFPLFTGGLPQMTYSPGSNVSSRNVMLGAQTYGNVEVPAGARCALLGTRINGNLELHAGASVDASNATINGSVERDRVGNVHVRGGRIQGSVEIRESQALSLGGTRVGSVELSKNVGLLSLSDLRVSGDIPLLGNKGGVTVNRNSSGGNLQCGGNDPAPTGAGNNAAVEEGQCRQL